MRRKLASSTSPTSSNQASDDKDATLSESDEGSKSSKQSRGAASSRRTSQVVVAPEAAAPIRATPNPQSTSRRQSSIMSEVQAQHQDGKDSQQTIHDQGAAEQAQPETAVARSADLQTAPVVQSPSGRVPRSTSNAQQGGCGNADSQLQQSSQDADNSSHRRTSSRRPPLHSPPAAPRVLQRQPSTGQGNVRPARRLDALTLNGSTSQQQPPLSPSMQMQLEPLSSAEQPDTTRQRSELDILETDMRALCAGAPSESEASIGGSCVVRAQHGSQDTHTLETYHSCDESGVHQQVSVMASVAESNGDVVADLQGCNEDDLG